MPVRSTAPLLPKCAFTRPRFRRPNSRAVHSETFCWARLLNLLRRFGTLLSSQKPPWLPESLGEQLGAKPDQAHRVLPAWCRAGVLEADTRFVQVDACHVRDLVVVLLGCPVEGGDQLVEASTLLNRDRAFTYDDSQDQFDGVLRQRHGKPVSEVVVTFELMFGFDRESFDEHEFLHHMWHLVSMSRRSVAATKLTLLPCAIG